MRKSSSAGLCRKGDVSLSIPNNVALFVDLGGDFTGGSRCPKVRTQNESFQMRLFMTLSWTRRIWPSWTPLIWVTTDRLPGTLSMFLEASPRKTKYAVKNLCIYPLGYKTKNFALENSLANGILTSIIIIYGVVARIPRARARRTAKCAVHGDVHNLYFHPPNPNQLDFMALLYTGHHWALDPS